MSFDNRQSRIDDQWYDDWYDRDDPYRHVYDAYGNVRDLHAEMEHSWRCLCYACGWSPDGMSKADANLENFYAGGL